MTTRYNILALNPASSKEHDLFYHFLQEAFSHLFQVTISASFPMENSGDFHAVFSDNKDTTIPLPQLIFTNAELNNPDFLSSEGRVDIKQFSTLNQKITSFYLTLSEQVLNHFPFQIRQADYSGHITYHNHQFNGSFFEDDDTQVEPWIYKQLHQSTSPATKHFLLASASADHIYYQTYQAVKNKEGHYIGSIDYIQDIKPILADYLEETAQAIVGWSDVISGPSISDDL
ncbi:Na+ driven multidrug efflux pump [Streptococcus hongkongensis]|nr:Na+ driven multidrug efflux pump [Streptococcus uberis]